VDGDLKREPGREILQAMQEYVSEPHHRAAIEEACAECEAELRRQPELGMAYRVVAPLLELAGPAASLRSLWVFAFTPRGESDTHRHSNSTQYTRAWRGQGRLRIGDPDRASEVILGPPGAEPDPAQDWVVIPPGTFHHAVAGEAGWCVVSFHTVPAAQLQDEPFSGAPHYYLGEADEGR
jgi:quercetin dioxygenase-like cupin family protein